MSEFDDYDENDDEQEQRGNQPNDLRKLIKKLQKDLKERDDALATFQAEAAQRSLSEALSAAGVTDPRAALLFKAQGGDASKPEAITEWLKDNGELFGVTSQEESDEQDNTARQWQQQTAAAQAGRRGGDATDTIKLVRDASSPDELYKILRAQGVRI